MNQNQQPDFHRKKNRKFKIFKSNQDFLYNAIMKLLNNYYEKKTLIST